MTPLSRFSQTTVFGAFEEWRPIVGYEGLYEVSSLGRVRSARTRRIKNQWLNEDGYRKVQLCKNDRRKNCKVHRLVALAFLPDGQNPLHQEVAHIDGDRANAVVENLCWVSHVENCSHKIGHGTHPAGEMHPRARLRAADVKAILASCDTATELAAKFGISTHTVADIRRGKRWKHVNRG